MSRALAGGAECSPSIGPQRHGVAARHQADDQADITRDARRHGGTRWGSERGRWWRAKGKCGWGKSCWTIFRTPVRKIVQHRRSRPVAGTGRLAGWGCRGDHPRRGRGRKAPGLVACSAARERESTRAWMQAGAGLNQLGGAADLPPPPRQGVPKNRPGVELTCADTPGERSSQAGVWAR